MPCDIVNVSRFTDALRSSGYKSVESAVAELIDNSIEAMATKVIIIADDTQLSERKGSRVITEIAVLDNGGGMNNDILGTCLGLGEGTRTEREGMGRFGVGLPQASLFVAPRVEVYSWQKGECPKKVHLDVYDIQSGKQKHIDDPETTRIPKKYQKYIQGRYSICNDEIPAFSDKGTLVVWKSCDNLQPRTSAFLVKRFHVELGRRFRYFLSKTRMPEKNVDIYFLPIEDESYTTKILPNDPLYLFEDNYFLASKSTPRRVYNAYLSPDDVDTEDCDPSFEPFTNDLVPDGIVEKPIRYICPFEKTKGKIVEKTGKIKFRFSIVKIKHYVLENDGSKLGSKREWKDTLKNIGISVLRAGREIDFGQFDFFNVLNEPDHRWWGCEIEFGPELDEVFNVSNNKQHVELKEYSSGIEDEEGLEHPWGILYKVIDPTIRAMMQKLSKAREGTGSGAKDKGKSKRIENAIKNVEKDSEKETETKKTIDPQNLPGERYKVEVEALGEIAPFINFDFSLGTCKVKVNSDTGFYEHIYKKLENAEVEVRDAFDLFLLSIAQARNEAVNDRKLIHAFMDVIDHLDTKMRKYLRERFPG